MTRENVPSPVKRLLRQEAGYGCCRCGHPFYQYHHIIPYAEEAHMRPEDMMLLCGNCHPLATVGALTREEQRTAKANPKNIADNLASGKLYTNANDLVVNLAGGRATNVPILLRFAGIPILKVQKDEDGRLLVSAMIQDEEGNIIAELDKNEWLFSPLGAWDFEAYPKRTIIRSGPRQISFEIDCRGDEIELKGQWFFRGTKFSFTPTRLMVGTDPIASNFSVRNVAVFLDL